MIQEKNKIKIFCVVGTRPEFIKMFPVYKRFWELSEIKQEPIEVKWVSSSQHEELLQDLYSFFKLKADYKFSSLAISKESSLSKKAANILKSATKLLEQEKPDLVVIQGDTLTSQQVALAAFYNQIPIAHIEAGLRTNDVHSPFPEELARRIISQVSDLDFAPTQHAQNNLEAEKILFNKDSYSFLTGNTVIDTLQFSLEKINSTEFKWGKLAYAEEIASNKKFDLTKELLKDKKRILITSHRRENNYSIQTNLTNAIYRLAQRFRNDSQIQFIISAHKNPESRKAFLELASQLKQEGLSNVLILEPLNYPLFLHTLQESYLVVTDSGGIQEEAPYLCKPILIFRNETERVEGVSAGFSRLIGTEEHTVHGAILELITDQNAYESMIKIGEQPYGDGLAAQRIAEICLLYVKTKG